MNEIIKSGIYAITTRNKVVYIGSTKNSFAYRWGRHVEDAKQGRHSNPELSELIRSGNFDFLILEATDVTGDELFGKERYYIELYKPKYCINVGGGGLIADRTTKGVNLLKTTNNVVIVRDYILSNWYNVKISPSDKQTIIDVMRKYHIECNKFMYAIKQLGFKVYSFKDKKNYIITETTY